VARRLGRIRIIIEAELRTAAAQDPGIARPLQLVENFLRPLTILEFTSEDGIAYARPDRNRSAPERQSVRSISSLPRRHWGVANEAALRSRESPLSGGYSP
jgi:hypothetical protein